VQLVSRAGRVPVTCRHGDATAPATLAQRLLVVSPTRATRRYRFRRDRATRILADLTIPSIIRR
jgi:hypothetical protein